MARMPPVLPLPVVITHSTETPQYVNRPSIPLYEQVSVAPTLPLGSQVFKRLSGIVIVPELICGALSWLLITGTGIPQEARLGQGWVMFVTVTTFILAAILFLLYLFSIPKDTFAWVVLDTCFYCMAFVFYFSAAVLQANTASETWKNSYVNYELNAAATVFIFITTVLYGFSSCISLTRWRQRKPC